MAPVRPPAATRLERLIRRAGRLFFPLLLASWLPAWAGPAPASLRVVLDDNYPPYIFRDADGEVKGILRDYWDLWQRKTGIAVEMTATDWSKAQEIMKAGQADVIDTIFETPERKKSYDFSRPYATIEVALFFHRNISGITDAATAKGFTIGVKDGDACIDYLQAQGIDDFKRYPSYEAEVQAAARQEFRVFCIDRPPALYFFSRAGMAADFRQTPPLYVGAFHRAYAKGNGALRQRVEDGFARITPEEFAAIETRWFGEPLAVKVWPGIARYGAYAVLALLLLALLLVTWNWSLQRRVTTRTRALSGALANLKETETRFRTLFEQANDAILIMHGPMVIDCNRRAEILYGQPRARIIGHTPLAVSPPEQPDGSLSAEVLQDMVAKAEAGQPMLFEWRNQREDGSCLDVEVGLNRVEIGGETCLQAIVRDITERKQAQAEIQRLAFFDPLTQLPNRRLLLDRLRQALAACGRRHTSGALLFIDLDNFKTLNDTRGHDMGDRLLQEVARRLRGSVRTEDFIARLGGDEFVVLLEDLHGSPHENATHAEAVAHKILATIGQSFRLDLIEHHSTTSIGLCLFTGARDESVEELLKRADAAMYRAKTAGRNTLRFFDPAMQESLESRAILEGDLRRALPQQQFQLFYQPQIDSDNRIGSAEALLRWNRGGGYVPLSQFIPLAEETGLIMPIGQWVLETACRQLRDWSAQPGMENFRISVNISPRQFRNAKFVDTVRDIVIDAGIAPHRLTLELTESIVLDDVADSIEKMHALKALGIGFSMDDFGTGYSSLAYLKRLPLDELKIDQSFVRDIATDPGDAVIVRTIIAMARSLGLAVVAEGVETAMQREFLLRHECDMLQGFLFGKPMPTGEFERLLDGYAPA